MATVRACKSVKTFAHGISSANFAALISRHHDTSPQQTEQIPHVPSKDGRVGWDNDKIVYYWI